MTELERHLLSAFEKLEVSLNQQLEQQNKAQSALQSMFEATCKENQVLSQRVESLTDQVNSLTKGTVIQIV